MLHLTCSPLGARNPIFSANFKILTRFVKYYLMVLHLKWHAPPHIDEILWHPHLYLDHFMAKKNVYERKYIFTMEHWKRDALFFKGAGAGAGAASF